MSRKPDIKKTCLLHFIIKIQIEMCPSITPTRVTMKPMYETPGTPMMKLAFVP